MKKCHYYNNAQTACTLMLDDFSGVAVTNNGMLFPGNDWGYGLNTPESLWQYFEQNLLDKYPEIKGSIFFATQTHRNQNKNSGYTILTRDIDDSYKYFINKILPKFEIAFHGTTHGKYINKNSHELLKNYIQEFEYVTLEDIPILKAEIKRVEDMLETKFHGGKYCGYKKNENADKVIENLGFKWWASSADMINKKHPRNKHSYFGSTHKLLDFPTNVSGDIFHNRLKDKSGKYPYLRLLKSPVYQLMKEKYLEYLYENGLIISIQEHFQNQRTDGKRQSPNVFDDIISLDKIFGLLRGSDIWYDTCSKIAHYLDSYDNTDIIYQNEGIIEVKYNGRWENPFLSFASKNKELKNLSTDEILRGVYKGGNWIFNNICSGLFKII